MFDPPRLRLVSVFLAVLAVVALLPPTPAAHAGSELRSPVMNSRPTLSESEVLAWFRSVRTSWEYRASVPAEELLRAFREEGTREGVDWNVAFAQAILETAWFNFPSTGQVRPEDNNFGGMGAYDGQSGQNVFRFPDARTGVRAKMQHLRIYGDPTVNTTGTNLGSPLAVDVEAKYPDRWRLVRNANDPYGQPYHASAQAWQDLGNGRWATDPFYACKVLNLYRQMLAFNGRSTVGLPTNPTCLRTWYQRLSNTAGDADQLGFLGREDDQVLACDFNGDGRDTPATFDAGRWTVSNSPTGASPSTVSFGRRGDLALCGDWDGDGKASLGVVRDGTWHLSNGLAGGDADLSFVYGRVTRGDIPIVGDWNASGTDGIGIIRNGEWHLRNRLSGGPGELVFVYGRILAGDRPLVGDWDGDGRDGIGIARASTREWHLRNRLSAGYAERTFVYGRLGLGDVAVVGDWNGDGHSTPAIVRE